VARPAVPHADIIVAGIEAAEAAGLLPRGGVYGHLVMPDPVHGACCDGSAVKGSQYCTCWEPRFDAEQQPVIEGEPGTRTAMCGDCAFKPGSPERQGDERYNGDPEFLDRIVVTGERFFCHAGIRQAVKLVHPSGAEVDLLALVPGDYRPPIADGIPYKADGSPGDLCAGWAARRRAYVGKPMPEFGPHDPAGEDHLSSPAASPAPSAAARPDAAEARETAPPSVLAPAPESAPPSLPGPSGLSSPLIAPPHREDSPDSSPPGTGSSADAPVPGGTTGLSGEDFRKAVRAAQSARAKEKRAGRGRYPVKRPGSGYAPGMARRMPPGGETA
jgi:hypothetical protein